MCDEMVQLIYDNNIGVKFGSWYDGYKQSRREIKGVIDEICNDTQARLIGNMIKQKMGL